MQTIGIPYANDVCFLRKGMMYKQCARLWYAFLTIMILLLHIRKDASSHKCACNNCKSNDDEYQV